MAILSRLKKRWTLPTLSDVGHWGLCLMLVAFLWWCRAGLWALDMMAQFLCWVTGQNDETADKQDID